MSTRRSQISVFSFLDYREFLRVTYAALKKSRAGFSFRTFSQMAGFGSSNFYKLVMDGDRNLTNDSALKFAKALGLNRQETDFFLNLVDFTQAEDVELKQTAYKKLLQSRKYNELKPIEKDQYQLYSTWYHPVVLELATSTDHDGTAQWIADRIHPQVEVEKIEKSLALLQRLGFLTKNSDGKFDRGQPLYTTGPEAASVILHNYHQSMLSLAKEILPSTPAERRDISALTLGIGKDKFAFVKKKIAEFRQELLKVVATEDAIDEVIFVNIQMFPVTKNEEKKCKS